MNVSGRARTGDLPRVRRTWSPLHYRNGDWAGINIYEPVGKVSTNYTFFYLAWFVDLKSNSFRKRSQNKLSAKEHMKTRWPIFKVMWIKRRGISNAPMGFEPMTTCSQDRRPNQLSQGALHSIIITCFIFVTIFLLERLQRVKIDHC